MLHNFTEGLKLLDVSTGKWTTISAKKNDYPLDCAPDGKWIVYVDWESVRVDKWRAEEEELEGEAMWQGFVQDLYRYEVSTGKVERFAIRRNRPITADVISPDGKKAFIGGRHNTPFNMPEPKWEMRWLKNEWAHLGPIWLADSSGIVTKVSDEKSNASLGVEVFGENSWSGVFTPGRNLDIKGRLGDAKAMKNKTISLHSVESYSENDMGRGRDYFYICDIEQSGLKCKEILDFDLRYTNIYYAVLPDGDIIYRDTDDKCIRRFSRSMTKIECIVDGPDLGRFYGLSPDARRIAYVRYEKKMNNGTNYNLYTAEVN